MANKQELKLKSPMEAHMDGKMETKLRYKVILALVKEQKEAIQEKHKEELNVVEIQSKLSILDQLEPIFGSIMDEREKLVSDLQLAQARMNDVSVPTIDWYKLDEPQMYD
ncbi:Uncharacterized protein Rs2_40866 [Raphanus sativus]|nr:Uncharacterized protein Rs2_40866 [Raphanus sativus]